MASNNEKDSSKDKTQFPVYKKTRLDLLIPYALNSRTHSDHQVAQIAASIREFGFTNPILIDESNGIIAGHGRILAARKLQFDEVPCIILSGLSDAQKRAYVIADNQLALNAGWDLEALRLEIEHLKSVEFDVELLGFDDAEMLNLLGDGIEESKAPTEDEYKEVYEVVVSCRDEAEQEAIFQMMTAKGLKCRVLSM